jgi:hypothetical protein
MAKTRVNLKIFNLNISIKIMLGKRTFLRCPRITMMMRSVVSSTKAGCDANVSDVDVVWNIAVEPEVTVRRTNDYYVTKIVSNLFTVTTRITMDREEFCRLICLTELPHSHMVRQWFSTCVPRYTKLPRECGQILSFLPNLQYRFPSLSAEDTFCHFGPRILNSQIKKSIFNWKIVILDHFFKCE